MTRTTHTIATLGTAAALAVGILGGTATPADAGRLKAPTTVTAATINTPNTVVMAVNLTAVRGKNWKKSKGNLYAFDKNKYGKTIKPGQKIPGGTVTLKVRYGYHAKASSGPRSTAYCIESGSPFTKKTLFPLTWSVQEGSSCWK